MRLLVNRQRQRRFLLPTLLTLSVLLLSACASSGGGGPTANASDRILACKSTDTLISNAGQCLQDDAACYQISNGQWCTGERGSVCPAGSQALAAGAACPVGARCFKFSESMECMIN